MEQSWDAAAAAGEEDVFQCDPPLLLLSILAHVSERTRPCRTTQGDEAPALLVLFPREDERRLTLSTPPLIIEVGVVGGLLLLMLLFRE
jgi:hypothetical protein